MLTPLLLVTLLSSAPLPDATARDGLLVEAAAVPRPGTVRFSMEGGALPAQVAGADGQASVSVLCSVGASAAAGVEATNDGGKLSPAVSLRYQFASQESAPVNGVALVRFKSVGFSASGSEVEAEAVLGRSFGRFGLTVAGVAGRGFGADDAVAWRVDEVEVQAIAGWGLPRGTAPGGAMALALVSFHL